MIGRAAALTNLGDKDRAFRAKKQAFGSFFSLFPVSLHVDATEVAAAANPVFWQEDGSCMSGNGFLRLLFRLEIRRHGDVGKKPPFVTRVASRAHPLAGCRGAATEAARSAGKGRFGGNVETRISPAVVSPGNTTAWGRRKKASLCQREVWRECRNEDFSGCYFARKYNCMGTPKKSLPLSPVSPAERTRLRSAEAPQRKPRIAPAKGGSEGMSKRGFLRLLFRPEIRRHGDVGKKPPFVTRVASRAHPLAGCRGAATEAARSAGKGRFGGNVETRISPAVTSPGNTTAWGRRRNPTARGFCSPRSGGRAP